MTSEGVASSSKAVGDYFQFPNSSQEISDDTIAQYSKYANKDLQSMPVEVQLTAGQILREALRQIPPNVPNETAVQLVSQMTNIPVEVAVQVLTQNSSVLKVSPSGLLQKAEAQQNPSQVQNSQVIHTSDVPNRAMKISNSFGQLVMAERGTINSQPTQVATPSTDNNDATLFDKLPISGDKITLLNEIGRIRAFELNQPVAGNAPMNPQQLNGDPGKQGVPLRDINLQFARYVDARDPNYAHLKGKQISGDAIPASYPRDIDIAQLSRELPPLQRSPRKANSSSSPRRHDTNSRRSSPQHRRAATADSPRRYRSDNRVNQILVDPTTGLPLEHPYDSVLDTSNKKDSSRPSSVQRNRVASAGKPVAAVVFDSSAGQGSLPSRQSVSMSQGDSFVSKPLETFSIGEFNLPEYKVPEYESYYPQHTEIDYDVTANLPNSNLDSKTYSGITSLPTR